MIVTAFYNNGSSKRITDYELSPDTQYPLITRITEITISYEGKETVQPITVVPKTIIVTKIEVTEPPYKTEYFEGEEFKKEGMVVMATYSDESVKTITDYELLPNRELEVSDTEITINYEENGIIRRTTYPINVKPIPEEELYIMIDKYAEVQDGDITYLEGIQPNTPVQEILDGIRTNGEFKVYYRNGNIVADYNSYSATEMKLVITKGSYRQEYILVVRGDVNSDGEANFADILLINRHRLNKVLLKGGFLRAGNVNSDFVVNFNDMLKINKFRLGKIQAL